MSCLAAIRASRHTPGQMRAHASQQSQARSHVPVGTGEYDHAGLLAFGNGSTWTTCPTLMSMARKWSIPTRAALCSFSTDVLSLLAQCMPGIGWASVR